MPICIKSQICGAIVHIHVAAVFPTLVCMFNVRVHACTGMKYGRRQKVDTTLLTAKRLQTEREAVGKY